MEQNTLPVLFAGGLTYDITNAIDGWPRPNEKKTATRQTRCAGGGATNSAQCYRQLGGTCELLVPVGVGPIGNELTESLVRSGIHVHRRDTNETPISFVTPHGEDRSLIRSPAVEYLKLGQGLDLDADRFSALHLDGKEPDAAIYYAREFRARGLRVSLDVNPGRENTHEVLGCTDWAFASEKYLEETQLDIDGLFDYFRDRGCTAGGVTRGPKGVVWFAPGIARDKTPAWYVPEELIEDTSGAGDGFQGALLASWDRFGTARSWEQHIRFACAVAAIMVQQFGNQRFPTVEEVSAFQQPRLLPAANQ